MTSCVKEGSDAGSAPRPPAPLGGTAYFLATTIECGPPSRCARCLTAGHSVSAPTSFATDLDARCKRLEIVTVRRASGFSAVSISLASVCVCVVGVWSSSLIQQHNMPLCRAFGRSDGTRTRDLRRDRPLRGSQRLTTMNAQSLYSCGRAAVTHRNLHDFVNPFGDVCCPFAAREPVSHATRARIFDVEMARMPKLSSGSGSVVRSGQGGPGGPRRNGRKSTTSHVLPPHVGGTTSSADCSTNTKPQRETQICAPQAYAGSPTRWSRTRQSGADRA